MGAPTPGRIVHYTLSKGDAEYIGSRRSFGLHGGAYANYVAEGQVYPAVVVRVFDEATTTCNLKVLLDGYDEYWATSRQEGDRPGSWAWPPIVRQLPDTEEFGDSDEDEES